MVKTVSGADVICYANFLPFAYVAAFKYSTATPIEAISGIDQLLPVELTQTAGVVTGELALYRTKNFDLEVAGLGTPLRDLATGRYFSLLLTTRSTQKTLFQASECLLATQEWTISARGLTKGSLAFRAIIDA